MYQLEKIKFMTKDDLYCNISAENPTTIPIIQLMTTGFCQSSAKKMAREFNRNEGWTVDLDDFMNSINETEIQNYGKKRIHEIENSQEFRADFNNDSMQPCTSEMVLPTKELGNSQADSDNDFVRPSTSGMAMPSYRNELAPLSAEFGRDSEIDKTKKPTGDEGYKTRKRNKTSPVYSKRSSKRKKLLKPSEIEVYEPEKEFDVCQPRYGQR